ncbi:MAG TPA: hypothetical protein VK509_09520, partial [Polyangiales bacterium]|nr:hypothetical protein [Polyangiales bacterium]
MSLHRMTTLIFAAIALGSCADSRDPAGSSETHFLLRCSDDSCGPGLQCVCGTCSKPCSADAVCAPLADDARCEATDASSCATTKSCDVECSSKADCEALSSAHRCEQGRCRAPSASTGASTDAGSGNPLEPPLMSDPGLAYGPCQHNPLCGQGSTLFEQSLSGECVCVNFCESDDECPQPATGTVRPKCVHDDVVQNGMSGQCELPCAAGDSC